MEAAVFSTPKDLCSRQGHTVDMAPEIHMPGPVCLIENTSRRLVVNQEALKTLSAFTQPLVVVAIVGPYRTGKSYLMNKLAGKKEGFPLGSTVRSKTKGIWMWCVPHPSKLNHTLVLLDTEGLADVEKSDPENDSWIFALAVLLSSMLVYNSVGTINHQALEQLHYVTELTKLIRTKSSPSSGEVDDSAEFVSFFPDFVWAVRDFLLELKLDGRTITEDEYLENALKLIPGEDPKIQKSNMPREYIRKFFPRRKCFVFDWPTNDKKLLQHMEKVSENQLGREFQEQSRTFCTYIFTHAKTKTLRQGITVTGNGLGTLAKAYVDAINSGAVPCLENAVTALAELENSAAVQKAADHYTEQMAQRVSFPTDSLQELLDLHAACEREAIAIFMERSFKDDKREFQKKLVETIELKKGDFLLQNEQASGKYCQAQLEQLSEPLKDDISRGTFSVPGGHNLYLEAVEKLEQSYNLVPRKGVKANEVLQTFLQSQATTKESILQADQALSAEEKALAAECAKNREAEKELDLRRQKEKEQQKVLEAQEKTFKENLAQLKEKMERELETRLREQESMLELKSKISEELLNEGFKAKNEEMQKEINQLKEEKERNNVNKASDISQILDVATTVLAAVLPWPLNIIFRAHKVISLAEIYLNLNK
ncbi:guanylate-binding protein 7-like isoform 14-T15 [Molossus nigricans]